MDSIKDYLSSVVSYSLLFKIHTTLHLTKFTVEYSSSLGIINGNSYSFVFFSSSLFKDESSVSSAILLGGDVFIGDNFNTD